MTSEGGEDDETQAPTITGGPPGSGSDVSSLGLIREDEREYSGSRNGPAMENTPLLRRTTSYSERNPQVSETTRNRQQHRAKSEGTNDHRRHASQSSIAEALRPSGTNALSLRFDASFPTHDYQDHPSGLEIVAPTPIVDGPNTIHLWANRAWIESFCWIFSTADFLYHSVTFRDNHQTFTVFSGVLTMLYKCRYLCVVLLYTSYLLRSILRYSWNENGRSSRYKVDAHTTHMNGGSTPRWTLDYSPAPFMSCRLGQWSPRGSPRRNWSPDRLKPLMAEPQHCNGTLALAI